MRKAERQARAQRRATPHLDQAVVRIIEHGVAPVDAAQSLILFGAGMLVQHLTDGAARATVLNARDHIYVWMTEIADKVGEAEGRHHNG